MSDTPDWTAGEPAEKTPDIVVQLMALALHPLGVVKRRWIWMLLALIVGLAATAAFMSQLEPNYESRAKVVITSQQIPEDFVRSTVREDSFSNINAMVGEVLSNRNVQGLIDKYQLYPELREEKSPAEIMDFMRSQISIGPEQAYESPGHMGSSVFVVRYVYTEPQLTAQVTDDLAAMFINASLRRRNEQARLTTEFLKRELARAEAELNEAMAKVTEFTRENRGELPSDMTTHLNRLERLNAERKSLIAQISEVEGRIAELQARRDAPSSPEAELVELRLRLARELSLHTDEHPNVISLRRRISLLEDEVSEISRLSTTKTDSVDRELDEALHDREALRAQLAQVEAEASVIDQQIDRIPERSNELTALDQNAAVLRANYLDFMRKVQDAELAQELESAQQGPRVTLLDRAQVPSSPIRPPMMFLLLGMLGSVAAMLGMGLLLELVDPVVLNGAHLDTVGGYPLLGVIHRSS